MKKNSILTLTVLLITVALLLFGNYWRRTQPIWIVEDRVDNNVLNILPPINKQIIDFVEANGRELAPNYDEVVCTEFVIKVIDKFQKLSNEEKDGIRIITTQDIGDLIINESSIVKGVQSALAKSDKGTEILNNEDVQPGDFVQFWNIYQGKEYGHCGVILSIDPNHSLTVYSSHPITAGYGKQKYLWPDKLFFVRLK
jgi:hypothetical protein